LHFQLRNDIVFFYTAKQALLRIMGSERGMPSPDQEVELFMRFSIAEGLIDNFTETFSKDSPPPPEYIVDWSGLENGTLNITRIIAPYQIQHLVIEGPKIRFSEQVGGGIKAFINTISAVEKAEEFMERLAPIKPGPQD
jgi:hypothetical protein